MAQYRKKPVVIEAYQFDNRITNQPPRWLLDAVDNGIVTVQEKPYLSITVKTLEGDMKAQEGDWIIRGVKGELYPCKPDIFEATYEAVQ